MSKWAYEAETLMATWPQTAKEAWTTYNRTFVILDQLRSGGRRARFHHVRTRLREYRQRVADRYSDLGRWT